jgi:hypothetical protein
MQRLMQVADWPRKRKPSTRRSFSRLRRRGNSSVCAVCGTGAALEQSRARSRLVEACGTLMKWYFVSWTSAEIARIVTTFMANSLQVESSRSHPCWHVVQERLNEG